MEHVPARPQLVVIPGDGVGPEVIAVACRVLAATGAAIELVTRSLGATALAAGDDPVPRATVEAVRSAGVALKGPVATPADGSFASPNLALKAALGTTVQVREVRSLGDGPAVDVMVVRDTAEGLYAGHGVAWDDPQAEAVREALRAAGVDLPEGAALSLKLATEAGIRSLWERACDLAESSRRGRLTAVAKPAAVPHTDGPFVAIGREIVGARGLEFESVAVDTVAAQLVQRPERFELLVAGNLYGDIVSDVAGAVAGSIGLVSGRNIGPDATVFEPAHGCAFRHAGHDTVDPIGAVLCAAAALTHLGFTADGERVRGAVERTVRDGVVPADLARGRASVGTEEFGSATVDRLTRVR